MSFVRTLIPKLSRLASVYPSSYEGFGLPIIEAMAAGCPVITCSNSSLIEIAEGYAVLIPRAESIYIKNAIFMLENETYRRGLVLNAKKYSSLFNWDSTHVKMKDFYRELVSSRS